MDVKNSVLIFLLLACCCVTQKLVFYPNQNDRKFIQIKVSPIGFNPRSGQLDGRLVLAEPFDGCSPINNVQNEEEDVFVLINDQNCLQSIKAKNILKSGALAGIIRQNEDTTWHDREINIVHIPIIELQADSFDKLVDEIKEQKDKAVVSSILFSESQPMTDITIELWMSPTETEIYSYILNMEKFLNNQKNQVTFSPRFAMHSQKDRKSFIGCYSNGMYCPGEIQYDGRIQGQNIISQSLRQIIIRQMSIEKWWKYAKHFYVQCLRNTEGDVFMDQRQLSVCTRNSMMLAEIDYNYVQREMNQSFMGTRKQVDDNVWLREERQDYIREKVTQYPVLLMNKKEFTSFDIVETKMTICKMEHNRSDECSEILDGKLHSSEWFIILGVVLIIIVLILIAYKYVMYRRMQKQMKGEVTSTLQQYYRYMQTLQGDAQPQPKLYFSQKPESANNIPKDNKQKSQQQQSAPQIEIEMTYTNKNAQKPQQNKEGHQALVEQENH